VTIRSKIAFEPTLDAWLSRIKGCKPVTVTSDLGEIRQLCLYRRRRRRDSNAFNPDYALVPQTESNYTPHIFSHELTKKIVSRAVGRLLRKMGLKSAKGRIGLRPYDLRHIFTVHRVTKWYHQVNYACAVFQSEYPLDRLLGALTTIAGEKCGLNQFRLEVAPEKTTN
jgi:integrase